MVSPEWWAGVDGGAGGKCGAWKARRPPTVTRCPVQVRCVCKAWPHTALHVTSPLPGVGSLGLSLGYVPEGGC